MAPRPKKAALPAECCKSCRCYRADDSGSGKMLDSQGECRRYPPQPMFDEGESFSVSPVVLDSDWCAEWRPVTQ